MYTFPSPHHRYPRRLWVWLEKELKPHKKPGLCPGPTSACPFSLTHQTDFCPHSFLLFTCLNFEGTMKIPVCEADLRMLHILAWEEWRFWGILGVTAPPGFCPVQFSSKIDMQWKSFFPLFFSWWKCQKISHLHSILNYVSKEHPVPTIFYINGQPTG